MAKQKIIPVILCGGSGTRLWPASREARPKQFLSLVDDFSLLQNTVSRALRVSGAEPSDIVVVTLGAMADQIAEQLSAIGIPESHILKEPAARNTAAAVAFAAAYVSRTFGDDALMWVLPSDHHIGDENALSRSFSQACPAARDGKLLTFGITPTRPDTGYGYIRAASGGGEVLAVEQFVEKPDLATATQYLASGQYLWNSGMFLFTAGHVLAEFERLSPSILAAVKAATQAAPTEPSREDYVRIESQPFDKAIMEKSASVAVVPSNPAWSDIGSWESLWELRDKDEAGNVTSGRVTVSNARDCLIQSKDKLVAVAGLDNIVVVETDDAILIMKKSDNDSMKDMVKRLKDSGTPIV